MGSDNERMRYNVMTSLIDQAHSQYAPCFVIHVREKSGVSRHSPSDR